MKLVDEPQHLHHIGELPNLTVLNLNNCQVDSAELNALRKLSKLEGLTMSFSNVSESNLQFLSKMPALTRVTLENCSNIKSVSGLVSESMLELNLYNVWIENLNPLRSTNLEKINVKSNRDQILALFDANSKLQTVNGLTSDQHFNSSVGDQGEVDHSN